VAPLSQFSRETVSQLQLLGPFGQGNPRPVFATRGVHLASSPRRVGAKNDHLIFAATDGTGTIRCVGFGMGRLEKKVLEHESLDIAYEAQINNYNGSSNVEFVLADIQLE
jgi:single-stranded-DNA-specific exonuclease